MSAQSFQNTYQNASTPPPSDVPKELAGFLLAIDPVLAATAELVRVVTLAHQGACTQLIGPGWANARKFFSLSEKYAGWAEYRASAVGSGIHAYAHTVDHPIRLTDAELRSHPEWRGFGREKSRHPPMRGWLVAPLMGSDGENYGFIQASDRIEGDFTEQDEANLVRLAALTAAALDALAQVHLADYRAKIEAITPGDASNW
jgi:GAF domain-containing protein